MTRWMPQDILQALFKETNNVGCVIDKTTPAQHEKQRRVLMYGLQNGSITIFEGVSICGDYSFSKTITRLLRKGYISHSVWEPNSNGHGRHKRYYFNT